ncbi:sensor histidine kinase [Salinicola halimionae]|uniref:sensor histidine kinase n=1 Tax=Salinicola halimionae TaxID=1949081 RepID=UPI000DA11E40|nr:HAMP domain-containing sensor histidine kinase [Salinicola halimionae]
MKLLRVLRRTYRSLYARIALIYLASLIAMSLATAWIAVGQFDQLGREWLQRSQLDLAKNLATVMQTPLEQGADSAAAHRAAERIMSINPALSVFTLDEHGLVVAAYNARGCGLGANIDTAPIHQLLSSTPMLPVYAQMPCRDNDNVFSAARVTLGADHAPGYLYVSLEADTHMSMVGMWQTSSISRSLVIAGSVALALASGVGLLLFALLTRRFSRLTRAVQRFAAGDYAQRIESSMDDEIGRAGYAFNDMAATIEAQLDALSENDRQRREMIANLSHEFRTPLTSLRGYAQQLGNDMSPTDLKHREQLSAIFANVDRLTRLANQLSLLARVDVSDRPLNREPFSIHELANDIVGKFRPRAEAASISLVVTSEAGLALVSADLELIDRALTNLVDNALSATNAGGDVTLSISRESPGLQICVTDTGIGLAKEEIPLITQRFYRTAGSRGRGEGNGLGLAIVAEILRRHDTRLVIDSQRGEGTRCRFTLSSAESI